MTIIETLGILFIGAFLGAIFVGGISAKNSRDMHPDEVRLDHVDINAVSLAKTPDGDWVCMTGNPLKVVGEFAPDPRMAIDSAIGAAHG